MSSYADRIRAGEVAPWIDGHAAERDNALASAQVCSDELSTMARDDCRWAEIEAQREAWKARARTLASGGPAAGEERRDG